MLPAEITTETVRTASDNLDLEEPSLLERVADDMSDYAAAIADHIAEQYSLTEEQREELSDRIAFRFELLPA